MSIAQFQKTNSPNNELDHCCPRLYEEYEVYTPSYLGPEYTDPT